MATKPLFRDFMGLNTHTIQFKPELYKPVCRLLRDYHNIDWDLGMDTSSRAPFPMTRDGIQVNWKELYGGWVRAGYEIDLCAQFGPIKEANWKDMTKDPYQYGLDLARFLGPSGANKRVTSVEIGNEPGDYSDRAYRRVFESMAKGLRQGDRRLKILTCAVFAKKSGPYHKSVECVRGLDSLYDVINVHSYPQLEGWPTWKRSYPEDPALAYLKDIRDVIAWRNASAPKKGVWLTEFGYDATTRPQDTEGDFRHWVGLSDRQQAQYIVRSFLLFAGLDLERAYLFWFNDSDKASVHASSGITRNYQPKPSFYAMAHLYRTLGAYRFSRVVQATSGELYAYEFQHGKDPARRIMVAWLPTGSERRETVTLGGLGGVITRTERMPLSPGPAESVPWSPVASGKARLEITESPVYLWLRR